MCAMRKILIDFFVSNFIFQQLMVEFYAPLETWYVVQSYMSEDPRNGIDYQTMVAFQLISFVLFITGSRNFITYRYTSNIGPAT